MDTRKQYPSQNPTRKAWQGMMNRCYTTTNKDYPNLGGKGISVCNSWHDYDEFVADMGEKPANTLLQRYCEGKSFTPENTYWLEKIDVRSNRLYSIWKGMKRRCAESAKGGHRIYKDRGISMSPDWVDNFSAFAAHVGKAPSDAYTLDRIDNNLGYYPGNVRWADKKTQSNNKSDNIYIEIHGERKTLQEWCEFYGADRVTVSSRWDKLFTVAHRKNTKCVQRDIQTMAEIARYTGVKEAAQATGIRQGTIAKCLSGGNASAGGYLWCYID